MIRNTKGRFESEVTKDTWESIRFLLKRGNRAKDVSWVYKIPTTAVYSMNSRFWHVPLTRGASRGAKCHTCKKRIPNYREGKCLNCYNVSRRIGRRFGERHHWWKGGVTSQNSIIRNSQEYKQWRKKVFERDDYTCRVCNKKNGQGKAVYLEAHHIRDFANHQELRFEVSNGLTLCEDCHRLTDNYGEKAKLSYKKLICGDFLAGVEHE